MSDAQSPPSGLSDAPPKPEPLTGKAHEAAVDAIAAAHARNDTAAVFGLLISAAYGIPHDHPDAASLVDLVRKDMAAKGATK